MRYSLNGIWKLNFTMPDGRSLETDAPVPGNVEPVLKQNGWIEDYVPADCEFATEELQAVDDWCFTRTFDAPESILGHRTFLVFDGIDLIAEVYLNGEKILDCMNIHMQYTADVTEKLLPICNELRVVIRSAELWARKHPHDVFATASTISC